jgi:DNA repair and recombination protein RAD52
MEKSRQNGSVEPTTSNEEKDLECRRRTAQDLRRPLGPSEISYRPGHGGRSVAYLTGSTVIELMNEVFSYDGWSFEIVRTELLSEKQLGEDVWTILMGATVRIRLSSPHKPVTRQDIGCGTADNTKGRAVAVEKAIKEAVTDGLKRAARQFGNCLGNCVYDKVYLAYAAKRRNKTPRVFDDEELYTLEESRRGKKRQRLTMEAELVTGPVQKVKVKEEVGTEVDTSSDVIHPHSVSDFEDFLDEVDLDEGPGPSRVVVAPLSTRYGNGVTSKRR